MAALLHGSANGWSRKAIGYENGLMGVLAARMSNGSAESLPSGTHAFLPVSLAFVLSLGPVSAWSTGRRALVTSHADDEVATSLAAIVAN